MKELEEMALAAGMDCMTGQRDNNEPSDFWEGWPEQLLSLANAIEAKAAAKEREACAKLCEARQTPGTGSVAILNGAADAIRARGATDGKPT